MYKLLVLDMDGTLLNEQCEISKDNIEAIKKARQSGVRVAIATGRTKMGIDPYLDQLGINVPGEFSVVCSGARILENNNREILSSRLTREDLNDIVSFCRPNGFGMHLYSTEGLIMDEESIFTYYDSAANNMPIIKMPFHEVTDATPIDKVMVCNTHSQMVKALGKTFPSFYIPKNIIDEAMELEQSQDKVDKEAFNTLGCFPENFHKRYNLSCVFDSIVEISKKEANKAYGIQTLMKMLDLKREEIMCIGDSQNDRHMVEFAGMGVAMGNACDDLKNIANDITKTNEESGVAHAIHKHILNEQQ